MGKARLIGMNNAYIPNSKADMRYKKNVYQRGRDFAEQHPEKMADRRERAAHRKLEHMKGVKT